MINKKKNDLGLLLAVVFVIAVIILGYFLIKGKKEVNPLEGKKVIDLNTSCDKVWEGAKALAKIYNLSESYPLQNIVAAECKTFCEDVNTTYNSYICTSDNRFLCYCNKNQ